MYACYIIYSSRFDRYYVGATQDCVFTRIQNHNFAKYKGASTSFANDWEIFLIIECDSFSTAVKVERHIKCMKSKTYIQNLKKYPEMIFKIKWKLST